MLGKAAITAAALPEAEAAKTITGEKTIEDLLAKELGPTIAGEVGATPVGDVLAQAELEDFGGHLF